MMNAGLKLTPRVGEGGVGGVATIVEVRVTVPVKPFTGATAAAVVAVWPIQNVVVMGLIVNVKS